MIPALIGAAGAIGAGLIGAVSSGIQNSKNVASQQANLDYQKALQQKVFEREDNAVQRRQDDLRRAGLNPYLAANQSANAGAVIPTNPVHSNFDSSSLQKAVQQAPGAFVDMARALEQFKQDKIYTTYMKYQNDMALMSRIDFSNMLYNNYGYPYNGVLKINDFYNRNLTGEEYFAFKKGSPSYINTQAQKEYDLRQIKSQELYYEILKNEKLMSDYNSDILKVKRDFSVSDKIEQYILDSIGALTGGSNSARGWYDSYNKSHQPKKMQNYRENYTRNRNGYTRERRYY